MIIQGKNAIHKRQSRMSLKKSDVKQKLEEVILGMSSARSDMIQRHSRQGSLTGKTSLINPTWDLNPVSLFNQSATGACIVKDQIQYEWSLNPVEGKFQKVFSSINLFLGMYH